MKSVIREYQNGDLEFVQQLLQELGYPLDEETLRLNIDLLHNRGGTILVAEFNDLVVGCLGAGINAGLAEGLYGEILGLVVSTEFRGLGLGRRLLLKAEEWFRPQVAKVRVRANRIRTEAHRFYRAHDYHEIKTQRVFVKEI